MSGSFSRELGCSGWTEPNPSETSASANTQVLLVGGEAPMWSCARLGVASLRCLFLGNTSSPQPWSLPSGAQEGHRSWEHKEGAGLTGSPEAVLAQRQARNLPRAPLLVGARCCEFCSKKHDYVSPWRVGLFLEPRQGQQNQNLTVFCIGDCSPTIIGKVLIILYCFLT